MSPSTRLLTELKQRRPFAHPSGEAAVAMIRTTDQLQRRIAVVVEPAGITLQQYNVLRILRGSHPDPLPTLEIAVRMIEEAPGITRLLDRLEAKALVRRERCREDRRQVLCSITETGLAALAQLDGPVVEVTRQAFAPLGDERTDQLIRLLDALREGLAPIQPETEKETS